VIKSKDGFSVDHKGGKLREHWWPDSRVVLPRYFVVVCFKMAVSKAVITMIRVLAIFHIVVGALLIIFGIADGVTALLGYEYMFIAGYGFYGVWIGTWVSVHCRNSSFKPCFHIVVFVVYVVSVVRKKFIGQIQLYGNLPYKCSIQQKREIQLVVRDRMNSICPMNFFRTTDTTDTTDTTIWKPVFMEYKLTYLTKEQKFWPRVGATYVHQM